MRKFILALVLITPLISFAQLQQVRTAPKVEIGKYQTLGVFQAESSKIGDFYCITYRNMTQREIFDFKSFSFKNEDNAFENLYSIIKKNLLNIPSDDIILKLPNGILSLKFKKIIGTKMVTFFYTENGETSFSNSFTQKQIDKIFGKNKT